MSDVYADLIYSYISNSFRFMKVPVLTTVAKCHCPFRTKSHKTIKIVYGSLACSATFEVFTTVIF